MVPEAIFADPIVADPKHYRVLFENEKVRILKISYGPFEQGNMHGHPDCVLVTLTEMNATFSYPDGKTEEVDVLGKVAAFMPNTNHAGLVRTATRFEGILVEIKPRGE